MQPGGTYQLIEALGSCQVGTVWSAVDAQGRSLTVAVLDAAVATDQRWRDAFAASANALGQGDDGGAGYLYADFSGPEPWVVCGVGAGAGAERVFLGLGMEYHPAPPDEDGGTSEGLPQPPSPEADPASPALQAPTVSLPPLPPSAAGSPVPSSPASGPPVPSSPVWGQPVMGPSHPESSVSPAQVPAAPQPASSMPQSPAVGPLPPAVAPPEPTFSPYDPTSPYGGGSGYDRGYPPLFPSEPVKRRRTGLWVAVAVVVVLAVGVTGAVYASQGGDGTPVGSASPTPEPTPGYYRRIDANTGVPKGTKLKVVKGDQTFGEYKQIYSNLDIRGNVRITGDNIVLRRSVIRGVGKLKGGKCTTTPVIWVDGATNVTIEDVEVYGANPNACLDGIWAENATLNRVDIHNVVDGVKAYDNVIVQYSYIHDLAHFASSPTHDGGPTHNDGVQSWEGNHNITLRRNTIKISQQDNSAFQVNQTKGTRATDIHVEENFLDGGWCTLNFSEGDGPTPMTGIYIVNNRFGPTSSCPIKLSATVRLSANDGNVWDDTGKPIPAPS